MTGGLTVCRTTRSVRFSRQENTFENEDLKTFGFYLRRGHDVLLLHGIA